MDKAEPGVYFRYWIDVRVPLGDFPDFIPALDASVKSIAGLEAAIITGPYESHLTT